MLVNERWGACTRVRLWGSVADPQVFLMWLRSESDSCPQASCSAEGATLLVTCPYHGSAEPTVSTFHKLVGRKVLVTLRLFRGPGQPPEASPLLPLSPQGATELSQPKAWLEAAWIPRPPRSAVCGAVSTGDLKRGRACCPSCSNSAT